MPRGRYVLGYGNPAVRGKPADFEQFKVDCARAYNVIRASAHEFINLFQLMLSTGIPELQQAEDINWLREKMMLQADDEAAAKAFDKLIDAALNCTTTQINNMVHIMAH